MQMYTAINTVVNRTQHLACVYCECKIKLNKKKYTYFIFNKK